MKFARKIGFPLSIIGLILYSPPLVKWLTIRCGDIGRLGGLILFAIGWALLLGDLAFNLGIQSEKEKD